MEVDDEHEITFYGSFSITSVLQYFPDELVETLIRGTVFILACEYKEQWEEYHIPISASEVERMDADYRVARNQIVDDYTKHPIYCFEVH